MIPLLAATRNSAKLRELRAILAPLRKFEVLPLDQLFGNQDPDEAELERFVTFAENAAAKALYFAGRCELAVLADDSGLCVDALGGAPGVRSRRYAADHGLPPGDESNNQLLLRELQRVSEGERGASYVCAVAVARGKKLLGVQSASCAGRILSTPHGGGGFGYDPLFWIPGEQRSFGDLPASRKNRISHRALAVGAAVPLLEQVTVR